MPKKQLEIRLGAAGDALDRFEAAWHRVQEGRALRPLERIVPSTDRASLSGEPDGGIL